MSKQLLVRPEAEEDLSQTYQWYEAKRKGLGDDFLLCVEGALARISRNPGRYRKIHGNIRRILTDRFPFGIFFIEDEQHIAVLAVLHVRRNPSTWKDRV
jgi:toxin ParE1/3/4